MRSRPPVPLWARHETEPGSKLAAGPEGGRIAHRGHHGRRAQHPDAGDLCDLLAGGIAAMPQLDPPLDHADLLVELGDARPLLAQGLDDHRRQLWV